MTEINDPIAKLASADAAEQAAAAAWLYVQGCALGDAATHAWRAHTEFAALLTGAPTVGVAVPPETFEAIRKAHGMPRLAEVPPDQDASEFELHIQLENGVVQLDILTTRAPGGGGAIAKFLGKFSKGIQQVEYFVSDVERATEILRMRFGVQPLYPQTRAGADGTRVNFFLCSTPEGRKVLIELVQQ
jgi:methylmalonyl-CoA/ethylmalonyl-CoA epimerase